MVAAGTSAAATSSSRTTKQKQDAIARRNALKKQRQRRKDEAEQAFIATVGISKDLPESKVKEFLSKFLNLKVDELEPNAVQLVIDSTRQNQDGGDGLQKEPLLDAVGKYAEYLKHAPQIDKMYKNFDKNGDGGLSKNEFRLALDSYERKSNRRTSGAGPVNRLFLTDEDFEFILEQADADNDGLISKNEMLPALAAWEELAVIKLERADTCECIIL